MTTLNRFAQGCLNIMRKRFKMNEHDLGEAFSVKIEAARRKFDTASKYRSDSLPKYPKDGELAAEMVTYFITYSKGLNCGGIEQPIKNKMEFDDREDG